jgi:hypothetical protein
MFDGDNDGLVGFCSDQGEEDEEKKLGMLKTRRR